MPACSNTAKSPISRQDLEEDLQGYQYTLKSAFTPYLASRQKGKHWGAFVKLALPVSHMLQLKLYWGHDNICEFV